MNRTSVGLLLDASGKPDWQVAMACDIHPSVISRYRSGERTPHRRHAEKLAGFFDCAIDMVLGPPEDLPYSSIVRVVEIAGPLSLDPDDEWID
jgi:transcriptional regulator with XRE-family HTH domain